LLKRRASGNKAGLKNGKADKKPSPRRGEIISRKQKEAFDLQQMIGMDRRSIDETKSKFKAVKSALKESEALPLGKRWQD